MASPLLVRFDEHMAGIGRASTTRRQYWGSLSAFEFESGLNLETAAEEAILAYLARVAPNGGKRANMHRALRAFYGWASDGGRIRPDNPARSIAIPRERPPKAPDYPPEVIAAFLRAAHHVLVPEHAWALELLTGTSMRVGSLVAIRRQDVNMDDAWLELRKAKAGRTYGVPMGRRARIAARHLEELVPGDLLVPYTTNAVRAWCAAASLEAFHGRMHLTPHCLRHAGLTALSRSGADESTVASFAGWDGTSQYRRYVAANEDRMRRFAETA